ncbi:DUF1566 domain-containing protein [Pseudoalteromonas fenneropenaei]|uniref:DUF1566 domain-containing protein n=1 Tax=Pseudoalteromonas fenneropenaei TaxID=1737459 RepID=A0ABV7CLN5_9GAMM
MQNRSWLAICSLLWLSACGGGGGEGNSTVNASINIGADVQVDEGQVVDLTALVSPAGGTVAWRVASGASFGGLPTTGETVSLTAPSIKADSAYSVIAEYTAPDGSVVSDSVTVSVRSVNQVPLAIISQTEPTELPSKYNDTITLSAEESSDPDEDGGIVRYQWQQRSGKALTVSNSNSATLSFSHPLLAEAATVVWQVTVTDDEGATATAEASLILAKNNQLVFANAGDDATVTEFETVTLDASASVSVSANYQCVWQQLSGVTITPTNSNACKTEFVAPDVDGTQVQQWRVTVTDALGYSATDDKQITIEPVKYGLIHDSGLNSCFDNQQRTSCGSSQFPRQDAQLGRDSLAALLDKTGLGEAGFDFTKLDAFADELPNDSSSFSCIRDNVSGLIWEVKEPVSGTIPAVTTRAAHNTYTWSLSGQVSNVEGGANTSCASNVNCGLQAYVDAVNATNYCGGSNWRVPTYVELMGLLDFAKRGQTHLLDTRFFPNMPAQSINNHLYFWTNQTSADGQSLSQAYIFDFASGNDLAYPKSNTAYVRLVRTP